MSTGFVTIGCKMPTGIVMEMGKQHSPDYERHVIKGSNDATLVGGYGITDGVPEKFAESWFRKYKHCTFVRDGLVFMQTDGKEADAHTNAAAQAMDNAGRVTGLERLDPAKAPKGVEVDMAHIERGRREMMEAQRAGAG